LMRCAEVRRGPPSLASQPSKKKKEYN